MALTAIHPGESLYDLRIAEQKSGKSIRNLPTLKRRKPIHA